MEKQTQPRNSKSRLGQLVLLGLLLIVATLVVIQLATGSIFPSTTKIPATTASANKSQIARAETEPDYYTLLNGQIDEYNRLLAFYNVGTGKWINYALCVDGLGTEGKFIQNTRTYVTDAKATDMSASSRGEACAIYFTDTYYPNSQNKPSLDQRKDVFKLKRATA